VPAGKPPRAGPPTSSTGSQAPPSRCVPVTTPARKPESHAATGTPPAVIAPYGCEFPSAVPAVSGAPHALPAPARSAAFISPPCFQRASCAPFAPVATSTQPPQPGMSFGTSATGRDVAHAPASPAWRSLLSTRPGGERPSGLATSAHTAV
jgi:hypothetical protein